MRTKLVAILGLALAFGLAHAEDAKWLTSYDDAVQQAKKDGRLVLAAFVKPDQSLTKKLKDEIFSAKEFQEWAGKKAVLVEVDADKNVALVEKLHVQGLPAIVFVDGDGKDKGRTHYARGGASEWIKKAEEALKQGPEVETPKKEPEKADKADKKDDGAAAGAWGESWDKAAKAAKDGKKLILANFTGSDWCPWCIKLHKEVFAKKAFKEWAEKNVVLLELDFPNEKAQTDELKAQNKKLLEKYGVEGFPTVLVLDADGKKVGTLGYMEGGPTPWIKAAQDILDENKK
jgi:protein disulfide-isomerase